MQSNVNVFAIDRLVGVPYRSKVSHALSTEHAR